MVADAVPVVIVEDYSNPYEGVKTFGELSALRESERAAGALGSVFYEFKMLSDNIMRSDASADAKASQLASLTTELGTRIAAVREDPDAAYKDYTDPTDDPGTFVAFRDASGALRWTTVHTNKYRDKTGEIMADAAHREYVEWVSENKSSLPVLRFWHVPAPTESELARFRTLGEVPTSLVDLGRADLVSYDDNGFVLATGTFYPEMADVAERLAGMKDLGCSHGYIYRASDVRNGVIERYRSFEVSVVPRPFEANTLTFASVKQEGTMLSPKQREAALTVLGEDRVKALEESMSAMRATADSSGVSYRAVTEALTEEPSVQPAVPVTPVASAEPPPAPAAEATNEERVEAMVRRVLAEQEAADRGDETPVAPVTAEVTPATVTEAQPVTATNASETLGQPPADEGSQPVPPADAIPAPPVADAPSDTKSVTDPMAGILAAMQVIVDGAITPLREALGELQTQYRAMDERVTEAEKSDDSRLAERLRPRVGPIAGAKAASESPETVLSPEVAQALRNQFKAAELPEPTTESGPRNLVKEMNILGSLQQAALTGGDAD